MEMKESRIDFYDETGELLPIEEVQDMVATAYNEVAEITSKQDQIYPKYSILTELIDPEARIEGSDALHTLAFLERELYLSDEITSDMANAFRDAINFWNRVDDIDDVPIEKRKPIKIYINTPGGDITATFLIIDCIKLSQTPVWTITTGCGYSGGFFIGISGHKRFGFPQSSYLFHEGCKGDLGDAHKFLQGARFYEKMLTKLKKITIDNTKINDEIYEKYKKDDLWLFAEEAKELGIIDEVIETLI